MISNQDDHHDGPAGKVEPPTTSSHSISSARRSVTLSSLKGWVYSKTIMGRGLMWAHEGTTRHLIPREKHE